MTKQFNAVPGMFGGQTGTIELQINLKNNSPLDALVVDALEDDLDLMLRDNETSGYTFVPNTLNFGAGCGVGANATFGDGGKGSPNAKLTITPGSIVIPVGQTCTVSNRVYVSGALGTTYRTNTIGLNTAKAHLQSLPLNPLTNTSDAIATHYNSQLMQIGKTITSPLKTTTGVPAVLSGMDSQAVMTVTIFERSYKNAVELRNVSFTDKFPTAPWTMKPAVDALSTFTSTCGGSIAWNDATNTLQFSGGTLPAGNGVDVPQCVVMIPVIAPAGAAGVVTNQLGARSVQDLNAPNGMQSILNANFDAYPTDKADLAAIDGVPAFAKSFSKTQLNVGEETTLKIELINSGKTLFTLNGVSFADQLPAGMVFKPLASATLSGDASCTSGTAQINGTLLTVSFAAALNITKQPCTVTVPVIAQAAGNLINTIAAGALQSTEGVTNPQLAEATVTAIGNADLTMVKTNDAPATGVKPGDTVHYTLTVGNIGPDAAAGATVTDTPPAGVTISGWTCAATAPNNCPASGVGSPVNVPVTVSNGGSVVFTVTAKVNTATAQTNTATVMPPPSVTDPDSSNNTATSTVPMAVDMAVVWTNVPSAMGPNQTINGLTLTCSNTLATNVAAASCVPSVPVGTISNIVCTPASGSALAVSQAIICTMNYTAPAAPPPVITFTGTTGTAGDIDTTNNTATANVDVIDAVNDSLGKITGAGGTTSSVLGNDKLGNGSATTGNVIVTSNGSSTCTPEVAGNACTPLTVSSDGTVTVPANATPGMYQVPYQICALAVSTACDTAMATITVTGSVTPVPETGMGKVGTPSTPIANVVTNDKINGTDATLGAGGNATIEKRGNWPDGLTLNVETGAVTYDGTTARGEYKLTYALCNRASPKVCVEAIDTVTITGTVEPVSESGSGKEGTPSTPIVNVVTNDKIDGKPAQLGAGGNATIKPSGNWPEGITLDTVTGAVNYDGKAKADDYQVGYELCDLASPPACVSVTDTVSITKTDAIAPTPVPTNSQWMLLMLTLLATVSGMLHLGRRV